MHRLVYIQFSLFANNCWNKQNQETYVTWPFFFFRCSFKTFQYFGVKTFPVQDMKRCYLQKKEIAQLFQILEGPYWLLYGIHELHCCISFYEKNTLTSIFKWQVAWKRGIPRPKFSLENLSPSPTLSYDITKKPKRVTLRRKMSLRVLKLLRIFIDNLVFRFHSAMVLFRLLIDRTLFSVLCDWVFFIVAVIDLFLGLSMLFYCHVVVFYQIVFFYQKQIFCFTFIIFSK